MTNEPDNTPEMDVTDNVALSDDDNSNDFDYYDPDEDQDTVEVEVSEETDDEPDEVEAVEAEPDVEAEESADEDEPIEDFVTKLKAETPRLAEYLDGLEQGGLRQQDYSRKTQEVANERKTVVADAQRVERMTEALVEQISALVPDAPDVSLAYTDPAKYTAQKAQHEAAMTQVQKLMELGAQPKEITAKMSDADQKAAAQEANQKLVTMFPEAAGGETRKQFFNEVATVATDLGFSNEELSGLTDHRIFALAHWAKKGMAAEQSKAKAKVKIAKAPPATPRRPGQGARQANGNAEAMRKLTKSGSIHDAMAIDFE